MTSFTTSTSSNPFKHFSHAQLVQCCIELVEMVAGRIEDGKKIAALELELEQLTHQFEQLQRKVFGRSSEKFVEATEVLVQVAGEATPAEEPVLEEAARPAYRQRSQKKPLPKSIGRFPDSLPREKGADILVSPEELPCPDCGIQREPFATEIVERLVYRRKVSLVVIEHQVQVCRCPECKDSIVKSPAPPTPLRNIQVESSVLAHILSEKYEFGLPFYRVEDKLRQEGFPITRATLCEYQQKVSTLLLPLEKALEAVLKHGPYMHADETRWLVGIGKKDDKKYQNNYAWMFLGAEGDILVKSYIGTLVRDSVSKVIGEYLGIIVCDGEDHYDHYNSTQKGGLARCNAHARRKFDQALSADKKTASYVLKLYGIVYRREALIAELRRRHLEKTGEPLPDEEVIRLRKRSRWLLGHLQTLCQKLVSDGLPTSPITKAAKYFLRLFTHLTLFCGEARLPIDNNPVERVIRKFVIGRKAWLFSSAQEGAKSSAIIYSLVLTCLHNDIPVFDYLNDVIHRIGVGGETDYPALLPRAWNKARLAQLEN